VKAHTSYIDEFPRWRVVTLRLLRDNAVDESGDREHRGNDRRSRRDMTRRGIAVRNSSTLDGMWLF